LKRPAGNLVVAGIEIPAAGSDEAQAPVFDFESTAIKPHQTVTVGVGNARFFETKASGQH
jgi:hypothetical protein